MTHRRERAPVQRLSACIYLALTLASANSFAQSGVSSSNGILDKAHTLIQQGQIAEAKTLLDEELANHPSDVAAYNMLGVIDSQEQNYSGALAAFESALKLAPNSAVTHGNLGNLYFVEKRPELAEKEFRTVIRLEPTNAESNYNLGLLLMSRGASAEAIPYLMRVRPATVAVTLNLIRANLQCKRNAEALRLAKMLSDANPTSVQVNFTLGTLLAAENQYQPAVASLEKANALQPGTFEILYNLGLACLRSGQLSDAEGALTRALKLKPDSPEALSQLAQVYEAEGRPRDALELLVQAHKQAPKDVDVIYLLAHASMSQKYYEDAIPLLEEGLQLSPQRADMIAALGQSYFIAGKPDQALQQFNRLIEIDPSPHSFALLGITYRQMGRFDEAKEMLKRCLKLDPHYSTGLFNLALIAAQQGDAASASAMFEQVLRDHPDFSEALLELSNLRIQQKRFPEAEVLLRKYIRVSPNPSTGYYKLGMIERNLHQDAEAERDLNVFKTLSRDVSNGPHHYEHLYDYLDSRSQLAPQAREQLDLTELLTHIKSNPGRPDDLYLLAETYLRLGKIDEAKNAVAQLDQISSGDYRSLAGTGVLLARYHLYGDAIRHFQLALESNPTSDEEEFDLAAAQFQSGQYRAALDAMEKISPDGRKDDAYFQLRGDIYAHLGEFQKAADIFHEAIGRSPDSDQGYLSLALVQLRNGDIASAKQTLLKGKDRCPSSGKIMWGLGIVDTLDGDTAKASESLQRAVDLLPEWSGSYSLLGVFYFQTGEIAKAREVFDRFKQSDAAADLDSRRIEQVLAQTPAAASGNEPMNSASKAQFLQVALSLADKTL